MGIGLRVEITEFDIHIVVLAKLNEQDLSAGNSNKKLKRNQSLLALP